MTLFFSFLSLTERFNCLYNAFCTQNSQLCVGNGDCTIYSQPRVFSLLPASSLALPLHWRRLTLSMHVAAALLAESSAGQWVGFSPVCLSNFLSPHCTSSQQFQHIQRWAVTNLHYLYMRSSKGFLLLYVMSAAGIPSTTLLPAQVAACFWQIVGNCILGKKILGRLIK